MNKSTVVEIGSREGIDPLNAMLTSGARQLIASAVEVELQELLRRYEGRTAPGGYAAVVRNGYQPERELQTGIGPVTVRIPKVRSRSGEKHFLAIEDGVRESTQSWREVLLKLQSRGMNTARLAIGDGARQVSGRPWKKCIRKRSSSAAGCTRPRTCSMLCRKPVNPMPSRRCMIFGRPRQRRMPNKRLSCFWIRMRRNIQRQRLVCRRIVKNCWPSTASRPNTGRACARAIPSNRPLAPYGIAPNEQRTACHGTACYT